MVCTPCEYEHKWASSSFICKPTVWFYTKQRETKKMAGRYEATSQTPGKMLHHISLWLCKEHEVAKNKVKVRYFKNENESLGCFLKMCNNGQNVSKHSENQQNGAQNFLKKIRKFPENFHAWYFCAKSQLTRNFQRLSHFL